MAGRRYLSSEEKRQLVTAASMTTTLEDYIEKLSSMNREKELLKHLRMAKTWLDKAVMSWMFVMPLNEMKAMSEYARKYKLILELKSEVRLHREQALKNTSNMMVDVDDFIDLVEASVDRCTNCDGTCQEKCRLYPVLLKHDVIPYQTEDATRCAYSYKEPEK